MKREKIIKVISGLFILLWLYAAVAKLLDYPSSYLSMQRQPLPVWSKEILTWLIPAVELILAGLLYHPRTRKSGMVLSTALMAVFTVYVGAALNHALGHIPCSCGGIISHFSWRQHFWFNIAWLLLAITGMMQYRKGSQRWETPKSANKTMAT